MLLLGLRHREVGAVTAGIYKKRERVKRDEGCEDVLFPLREGQGA